MKKIKLDRIFFYGCICGIMKASEYLPHQKAYGDHPLGDYHLWKRIGVWLIPFKFSARHSLETIDVHKHIRLL